MTGNICSKIKEDEHKEDEYKEDEYRKILMELGINKSKYEKITQKEFGFIFMHVQETLGM